MRNLSDRAALGLGCIAFALILAFVWIPLDTDTGLIEKSRGRYIVGDSLAPTLAAAVIFIAGIMLLFERADDDPRPNMENIRFIVAMTVIGCAGILVMRWAGPIGVYLFASGEEYRLLRDTPPWKYIGFITGGLVMVTGIVAFVEQRLSLRALLVASIAVLGIIIVFDLPFEDVLLPPNGDI